MSDDHAETSLDDDAFPETPGQTSEDRDRIAEGRDRIAEGRDQASEAHERAAEARDETAETRDQDVDKLDPGVASDRAEALQDRRGAARDRAHAAADREAAWSDRAVSAEERVVSSIDALTGVYRRDAGVMELGRELSRAKRTKQAYVLAFVDVDGLKAKNDTLGHAAGDHLLRQVADTIRAHLRSYDLIVRLGGDEFACGLLDLEMDYVVKRFWKVNADLEEAQASVSFGFSQLMENDSLEDLIGRADEALYRQRQQRPSART